MNQVIGLSVDDVYYHIGIEFDSMQRSFELTEGPNNGTAITGRAIRDILGTTYSYSMTVHADPAYPLEYDAFYEAITTPVDYHKMSFVYGQSTITFDAQIISGNDKFKGYFDSYNRWDDMQISFIPMQPQIIVGKSGGSSGGGSSGGGSSGGEGSLGTIAYSIFKRNSYVDYTDGEVKGPETLNGIQEGNENVFYYGEGGVTYGIPNNVLSVTNLINIEDYVTLMYKGLRMYGSDYPKVGMAYYDANGDYISGRNTIEEDCEKYEYQSTLTTVLIPEDAVYVRFTIFTYANIYGAFALYGVKKESASGDDVVPGGNTPGGDTPGGDTPGGDTPGGDTPGSDTPVVITAISTEGGSPGYLDNPYGVIESSLFSHTAYIDVTGYTKLNFRGINNTGSEKPDSVNYYNEDFILIYSNSYAKINQSTMGYGSWYVSDLTDTYSYYDVENQVQRYNVPIKYVRLTYFTDTLSYGDIPANLEA